MKVISGPEPLTPHQLGAKLWNTPYKGKTIGQWAESSWHDATVDVPTLFKSEGLKILAELGLLVMFSQRYLHFMHLHKLTKALPELRPYVATLATWEGVYQHGHPYLKSDEHPESAEHLASPTPQQIGAKLWSATYKGQTVGQLFLATLSVMRTLDLDLTVRCPERALLIELGLSAQMLPSWSPANPGDLYVHFMDTRLLYKKLPELKRWSATFAEWYGVKLGGVPYPLEPGAIRKAEPSTTLVAESEPVESTLSAKKTATVIQFPVRR